MPPLHPDDDYDTCVKGWEWRETGCGVPYYVSETLGTSTWDHPYYSKIIQELDQFQDVHYAAYRTALKLRHLQKRLGLHLLTLQGLRSVFGDHGFAPGYGNTMDCQTLQLVLLDMLHTSDFRHFDAFRQDITSELLLNYLLNLYDPERSGVMQVKSVKIALAALSGATLSEKYQYFFKEMQTGRTHISKKQLVHLIQDLIQIPDLLRESVSFGKDVAAAVNSCVQIAGLLGDDIPEDGFYTWLLRDPQTFIWLPTLHRLTAAETVKHKSKCGVCKTVPIVGFRYKCLQCFKFNLCQDCFFKGKVANGHQLRHPIQEYCLPASAKDDTKALMKIMRNKLGRRNRHGTKVTYLPVDGRRDQGILEWEMRPVPPPPSPQRDPNSAADSAAEAGSGSLDSGNSSESGGDGGSHHDQTTPSPSHGSFYDNSNSPSRYLEERQPLRSGQMLQQEKHSLIHLLHRLRRENRLLRQQLRAGRCSPGERDMWTSHATAEVTVEPIPSSIGITELAETPNIHRKNVTEAAQTNVDDSRAEDNAEIEQTQSVLSHTISPIGEASTTVNTQRYTSDFFNSFLSSTTACTPGSEFQNQATPKNVIIARTPGTVLASTPADPRTPAPPTILKTGPRKPPRLTGGPDKAASTPGSPVIAPLAKLDSDDELTCQADKTERKVPRVAFDIGDESETLTEEAADKGESPAKGEKGVEGEQKMEMETPSSDQAKVCKDKLQTTTQKEYGQTPVSTHTSKSHMGHERRLPGKSSTGQASFTGHKMSASLVSPTGGNQSHISDIADERVRRKSTGNLDETIPVTPHYFGLLGTPDSINFQGSLDALQSFDFSTPGTDRNMFAISRGDSCLLTPERQEIDAMIKWIDTAFPPDLSYSALSLCHHESTSQGRMLKAAESIGHAMADLVQATADNCYM